MHANIHGAYSAKKLKLAKLLPSATKTIYYVTIRHLKSYMRYLKQTNLLIVVYYSISVQSGVQSRVQTFFVHYKRTNNFY